VPAKTRSRVQFLETIPLFSACSRHEIATIARAANAITVHAGEALAHEGQPGHEFFVVIDGIARVTLRGETLATLGPGNYVGELALLDLGPRSATVEAETDMELLVIEKKDFMRLLDDVPILARRMLTGLALRLRQVQDSPTSTWNVPGTSWNRL
jgi:CRP/FNR family cyclic AMP-dependent transcriptional regulator